MQGEALEDEESLVNQVQCPAVFFGVLLSCHDVASVGLMSCDLDLVTGVNVDNVLCTTTLDQC